MQHPVITATPSRLLVKAKASNFPQLCDLKPIGNAAKLLTQLEALPICGTLCETKQVQA